MSPRIIHVPLSGRDRRHYVRELRAAEQAHRDLPAKVEEAYRAAHRLACEEWNVRQFIGGPAPPSPQVADGVCCGRGLGGRVGGGTKKEKRFWRSLPCPPPGRTMSR